MLVTFFSVFQEEEIKNLGELNKWKKISISIKDSSQVKH